jgi:tetratricopeptide (TPR) repeat protein
MTTILIIGLVIVALLLIRALIIRNVDKSTSTPQPILQKVSVDSLLKRAIEKQLLKDYKAAIAIVDKILVLDQNNYEALICRGSSLENLNFNLEAIEDYEKALKINNSDPNIYGLLGLYYIKIGDIENGLRNLKNSVQMGLKFYELSYNIHLSASEPIRQAIIRKAKIPENLLRRNPDDFIINLESIDKNEFAVALKNQIHYLEEAMSLYPDDAKLKKLHAFAKSHLD